MTSLGDEARETLTTAVQEKAPKEQSLEGHLRLDSCVRVWISTCERRWTRAVSPRQWKLVARDVHVCLLWHSWTRECEVSILQCQVQHLWQDWTSQSDVQTT